MRYSVFSFFSSKDQALLVIIILAFSVIYAIFSGRVFFPIQPTRAKNPILFYVYLLFMVIILGVFSYKWLAA